MSKAIIDCRSVAEAHLYLDIRGCEPGRRGHRLETIDGELVAVYECRCAGVQQRFQFKVLDDPLGVEGFGGDEPSRILGPGELLLHANELASRMPGSPAGLDVPQIRAGHQLVRRAAACVREVLKFVPAGEEDVPSSAFTSTRGKEAYLASVGRFSQGRLEAVARAYEGVAARFAEAETGPAPAVPPDRRPTLDPEDLPNPVPTGALGRLGRSAWLHEWSHVRGLVHCGDTSFSVGGLGHLYAWSTKTGTRLRRLRTNPESPFPGSKGAGALARSPDGSQLAVAGMCVTTWRADDLAPLARFGSYGASRAAAFSPDGRLLAVLVIGRGFVLEADLAFSPDGSRLAMVQGMSLHVFEIPSGEPVLETRWSDAQTVWFPDNDSVWVGGPRGGVQEVRLSDGAVVSTLDEAPEAVRMRPSRDGSCLAIGLRSGNTLVVDMATRTIRHTLEDVFGRNQQLDWSPDGTQLLAGGYSEIRHWDTATGARLDTSSGAHPGGGISLAFSRRGDRIATVGFDGTLRIWDLFRLKATQSWNVAEGPSAERARFGSVQWTAKDSTVVVADHRGVEAVNIERSLQATWVRCEDTMAIDAKGGRWAATASGQTLDVWSMEDRKLVKVRSRRLDGPVGALGVDWDGRVLIGYTDRLVREDPDGTIAQLDGGPWTKLLTPGKLALAQQPDGRVWLIALDTLTVLGILGEPALQRHPHSISDRDGSAWLYPACAVHLGSRRIAIGGRSVTLWSHLGKRLAEWEVPWDWTQDLAFDPTGKALAAIGSDGTVVVWSTPA
jgi:WD40 repeat protein